MFLGHGLTTKVVSDLRKDGLKYDSNGSEP